MRKEERQNGSAERRAQDPPFSLATCLADEKLNNPERTIRRPWHEISRNVRNFRRADS